MPPVLFPEAWGMFPGSWAGSGRTDDIPWAAAVVGVECTAALPQKRPQGADL